MENKIPPSPLSILHHSRIPISAIKNNPISSPASPSKKTIKVSHNTAMKKKIQFKPYK